MSTPQTLEAATQDRKARLAHLKTLKRKQPPSDEPPTPKHPLNDSTTAQPLPKRRSTSRSPDRDASSAVLSGRNYDASTRGPRLGFETQPQLGQATVESQARQLAEETRRREEEEERAERPLDLFKLQPKKANWDLKREMERRVEVLNVRTENAIARMVRERVEGARREARGKAEGERVDGDVDGEVIGMEGNALVEATREMEREAEGERDKGDNDDLDEA